MFVAVLSLTIIISAAKSRSRTRKPGLRVRRTPKPAVIRSGVIVSGSSGSIRPSLQYLKKHQRMGSLIMLAARNRKSPLSEICSDARRSRTTTPHVPSTSATKRSIARRRITRAVHRTGCSAAWHSAAAYWLSPRFLGDPERTLIKSRQGLQTPYDK